MNAKVNNAVKFREWWRPFAPSILREVAEEYLESAYDSPFMILTSPVRPEKRSVIPSVTHVDGSARPQTVEKDVNPLYWNLINEFGKRTGVPVVMNTSFNLRGEAIVNTPTDAVRTFYSSGMDALVIGSFLGGEMSTKRIVALVSRRCPGPHRWRRRLLRMAGRGSREPRLCIRDVLR